MTGRSKLTEIKLTSWTQFTGLAANMHGAGSPFTPVSLFRGLSREEFRLRPSLLRALGEGVSVEQAIAVEQTLRQEFQSQAHMYFSHMALPSKRSSADASRCRRAPRPRLSCRPGPLRARHQEPALAVARSTESPIF